MSNIRQQQSIPPLEDCIQSIKSLGFGRCSHGSKQLAKLFTECVAFHSYICRDSMYMEQRNEPSFPSLEDIPAMRAILEDKVMFKVFLSMLSSKTSDDSNIRSPSLGQIKTCARPVQSIPLQNVIATKQYQQQQQRNGRKRAFSSSSADDSLLMTPNKSMKMTKSPMQHGKDIFKLSALNVPTIPVLGVQGIPSSPDTNFSVLAAVIFYSVLRYVDQWPSIFLKLFAEDSFGPRIWADDERCQQFVKNLTLTLESSSKLTSVDVDVDADSFVSSFDSFIREDVAIQNGIENGNGSDSDSGDEEFVFEGATGGLPLPNNKLAGVPVTNAQTNDDSSSSGEELSSDEIVISVTSSSKNGNGEPRLKTVQDDAESESNVSAIQSHPLPCLDSNDKSQNRFSPIPSQSSQSQISQENVRPWWKCESVVTNQVCNRYFGHNKDIAFEMVGVALSLRLGEKVKQNSSLLATLPFFTRIPRVRSLATMQLEKWLQSPALSGLARKLFSTIVGRIENADPPLPEDISAIQSILSMSLKANQFHAHVENVIEIVKCVPTLSICRQIVLYLLREELDHSESDEVKTTNDNDGGLQMLKAVLQTIPQKLGHDVVASSLLILCMSNSVASLKHQITFLCSLLRKITGLVHNWYEGMTMVKSLLSHTDNHVSIEVTARLVLECMLLSVPSEMHDGTSVHQSIYESPLAPMMLAYKKMILKWALKAFDLRDEPKRDQFEAREPRTPVYDCILDGVSNFKPHQKDTKLLYCTLLLAGTNSDDFKTFLNKNQCAESDEQTAQVNSCILYGRVVDDEMIQMIIKAAKCKGSNIGNVSSIELVESLLFHCRKNTEGRLIFSDCQLVWDLYSLSEHNLKQLNLGKDIPRIACPGIWWRVTVISLIICGASPTRVGALMWDEHPTLRALMKMAVSKKFRFPPVDCDEKNREVMKADEYKMREEEYDIVEELFLSPEMRTSSREQVDMNVNLDVLTRRGTRMSARQREKQRKVIIVERQGEIARQQAEKLRIKRLLKDAQKALMLWDPRSAARKPPKKSVQLLFSASEMFHFAGSFIECTSPDYIINTIGSTNRDSIERAYDWLIPAISTFRSVINRLPPSASCFLLLRAYGQDTSDSGELLKLSAPLLTHVQKSLLGEHGVEGTKRAAGLLFLDITDEDADRRICARRVLLEALGKVQLSHISYPTSLIGDFKWLVGLLETQFAEVVTTSAIPQLTRALFLERGEVLYAFIHALHYYHEKKVKGCGDGNQVEDFSDTVLRLLSTRSYICCAAMDRHLDLYEMILQIVWKGFNDLKTSRAKDGINMVARIENKDVISEVYPSLYLLQAAVVLVANGHSEINCKAQKQFQSLTKYIVRSDFPLEGASSAICKETGKLVVSVEQWVSLVKARSEVVAKEAVQCVPVVFLPRLLLCCGLPEQSFLSMIQRLDRMGNISDNLDKSYSDILSTATINELGGSVNSKRSIVARRLHGRISAYRANGKELVSVFLEWLQKQCHLKNKGNSKNQSRYLKPVLSVNQVFTDMMDEESRDCDDNEPNADAEVCSLLCLVDVLKPSTNKTEIVDVSTQITRYLKLNNMSRTENLLEATYSKILDSGGSQSATHIQMLSIAISLLKMLHSSTLVNVDINRMLVRWIPILSAGANDDLLHLIFASDSGWPNELKETKTIIATHCLTVWNEDELKACQTWAMKELSNNLEAKYCTRSLLKCFIHRSSYSTAREFSLEDSVDFKFSHAIIDVNDSEHLTRLALHLAENWSGDERCDHQNWISEDWMIILLLTGCQSKDHLAKIVSTMLVDKYLSSEWSVIVFPRILLKLYVTFPRSMNLSDSNVREMLVKSSASLHKEWIEWSTPLDSQFLSILNNLNMSTLPTHQQLVIDFIKKHPLFAIKHVHKLVKVLEEDAVSKPRRDIERGRQHVRYPDLLAANEPNSNKVVIVHWGCGFSEPLWVAVLDIMLSFPGNVLFNCGQLFGLYDILNLYLILFKTQIRIANYRRAPAEMTTILRTRNKYSAILKEFNNANSDLFNEWINKTHIGSHLVSDLMSIASLI